MRSIAHTVERSHRVPTFRVGTPCSLSQRVIAAMLQPRAGVVLVDVAYNARLGLDDDVRRGVVVTFADVAITIAARGRSLFAEPCYSGSLAMSN